MTTIFTMAGLTVRVQHQYDDILGVSSRFAVSGEDVTPDISVEITDEDIRAEEQKTVAEAILEQIPVVHYPDSYLETTAIYRKIADKLPAFGGVVFHGSAVAVGEKAVLFAAHSGVGKTTHTRLWLDQIPGSYVVNGDKPVIRLFDGTPYVCGTPWMGKEKLGCTDNVPLRAIVFLSRGEQNTIEEVPVASVLPRLIEQTYRSPDPLALSQTLAVLKHVCSSVRFYKLTCNMEPDAAKICFEGISAHGDL